MDHKIRAATLAAELRQTRDRIADLEAENDRLGTAGMQARDWSRVWKRRAKMLWDDVRKCHGMANEINILTRAGRELEATGRRLKESIAELEMKQIPLEQQFEDWAEQNARYHKALARLTAAATGWLNIPNVVTESDRYRERLIELSTAIAEATAALGGGEDV